MTTYRLLMSETIGITALIEAKDEGEARFMARLLLEDRGFSGFIGHKKVYRNVNVIKCEQIKTDGKGGGGEKV
jgi:hypothetical protein